MMLNMTGAQYVTSTTNITNTPKTNEHYKQYELYKAKQAMFFASMQQEP